MRGYFGIGIDNPRKQENIGSLFRSAQIFGAKFVFTIGSQYRRQASDTCHSTRNIPYFFYLDYEEFFRNRAVGSTIIGVENAPEARLINNFVHPRQAIYILGSERVGVRPEILKKCNSIIKIDGEFSLNVAVAGSIIMYDRSVKA